jgi:hypothetical protein
MRNLKFGMRNECPAGRRHLEPEAPCFILLTSSFILFFKFLPGVPGDDDFLVRGDDADLDF